MPKRKSNPKPSHRVFSREFKISIVCRMLAGESVSALARELKMTRKDLYAWRDRFQAGSPDALRGRSRPHKTEAAGLAVSGVPPYVARPFPTSAATGRALIRPPCYCRCPPRPAGVDGGMIWNPPNWSTAL
jgi:transposase-like protein